MSTRADRRARSVIRAAGYGATGGMCGSHSAKVDWLAYLDANHPGHSFTMANTRQELVTAAYAVAAINRAARRGSTE